jgi:hypothetical protein
VRWGFWGVEGGGVRGAGGGGGGGVSDGVKVVEGQDDGCEV